MKKLSSYLPSLIISIVMVFGFLAMALTILADINFTQKNLLGIADKNALESGIYSELESYYKDKYNSSGIPAEVYMEPLNEEYLHEFEKAYISSAFSAMETGESLKVYFPENPQLEDSINSFFSEYADSIGYEKDEAYEQKLHTTKDNAYKTIGSYCDVYKLSALSKHGVLTKLSKLYRHRGVLTAAIIIADIFLLLLLLVINLKNKLVMYYWAGAAAIVAGIIGAIPALYLIATKYFDAFSIKQPQVFTAYTDLMYNFTEAFLAVQTAMIVVGISLLVIYGVMNGKTAQKLKFKVK